MRTLISILAHAEAQETFERHFPYWKAHEAEGADLLFRFPANSAFVVPGHQSIALGKKEHDGLHSIANFYSIMDHMWNLGYDRVGFLEYDSFCLGPLPSMGEFDLIGNIFPDQISEKFQGGMFVHPPFFVTRAGLAQLVNFGMKGLPFIAEGGFWDRWLGLAIKRAGLTCKSLIESGEGYSQNTIPKESWPDLRKAILTGARCIHGVKDVETFKVVQLAWNHAQSRAHLEEAGDVL